MNNIDTDVKIGIDNIASADALAVDGADAVSDANAVKSTAHASAIASGLGNTALADAHAQFGGNADSHAVAT